MKKLLILLLLSMCFASPLDSFGVDKVAHCSVSYVITDTAEQVLGLDWLQTGLLVLGIAILEESQDKANGGEFSEEDIVAGIAGWGLYRLVHFEIKF